MRIKKRHRHLWWRYLLIECAIIIGLSGTAFFLLSIFKQFLLEKVLGALFIDATILLDLLLYVFVLGGTGLFLIVRWADRDNIRFRMLQKHYRSKLMCPEYYKDPKRFDMDQFAAHQATDATKGKLDVDYNLKKSGLVDIEVGKINNSARQTHLHFDRGRLDGAFQTYFRNGNLEAQVSYKHGKLDGPFLVYYPNGYLHNEKHYRDGKLNGVFRAWDEDRSLFFEMEYKNGVKDGFDRSYFRSGTLQYEDTFVNGKHVERKTFDESGRLRFVQPIHIDEDEEEEDE